MRSTTPEASAEGMSPRVYVLEEKPQDEKQRFPLTINTVEPQNAVSATPSNLEVTTPSTARPFTGVSFASYYGMATNSRLTMPSVAPNNDYSVSESDAFSGVFMMFSPTIVALIWSAPCSHCIDEPVGKRHKTAKGKSDGCYQSRTFQG